MKRNWMVQGKLLHFHVSMTIKSDHHWTLDRPKMAELCVVHLPQYFFFLSQGSLIHTSQNTLMLLIQHRTTKSKTIFISLLTQSLIFVRKRACRSVLWFLRIHVPWQKTKTSSKNIVNPNNLNQATYYPHCIEWDLPPKQCVLNILFCINPLDY